MCYSYADDTQLYTANPGSNRDAVKTLIQFLESMKFKWDLNRLNLSKMKLLFHSPVLSISSVTMPLKQVFILIFNFTFNF